jgi:hypothetical protein
VQATSVNDDLARRNHQLDTDLAKAKIGIGKINILDIENKLQFGTYNDRAQNSSEVNKMITSFEKHGRQLYMIFVSRLAYGTGILPIFKTMSHMYPLFQMRKACYVCYDLRI